MLTHALEQALQSAEEERRLWKEEEALLTSAHLASARWMLAQCVTHARTRLSTFLRQVPAAAGCGSGSGSAANAAVFVGPALGQFEFAQRANSTSREDTSTPGASAASCDALASPAAAAAAGGGGAAGAQEDARAVAEACKGVDDAFDAAADVLSEVRASFILILPCLLHTSVLP